MPRPSTIKQTPPGKGKPAQVLKALATRRRCLTLDELAGELGIKRNVVTASMTRLITSNYVRRIEKGCYEATDLGRAAYEKGYTSGPQKPFTAPVTPRANTLRQRAWSVMQQLQRFTLADLLELAATPTDLGAYSNLRRYVRLLAQTEYVAELQQRTAGTAPTSNGFKNYLLLKNTGPLAPIVNDQRLRDPNTREVVLLKGGAA